MRIRRRLGPALLLVLCVVPDLAAHDEGSFDRRRATPGVTLELVELAGPGAAAVTYQVRVVGMPRDVVYEVWAREWRSPYREIASGVRVDDAGVVVSGEPGERQRSEPIRVSPGAYPRGAMWEIVLASNDKKITAFATVVPRPIRGSDGPCVVSLQLASPRADRFVAYATGFTPGDDVIIESRASGRVTSKRGRVSPDGKLPADLITHVAPDAERGARYSVKGQSCEVALEYSWGEPALVRR
jgi:hypothetical protein